MDYPEYNDIEPVRDIQPVRDIEPVRDIVRTVVDIEI